MIVALLLLAQLGPVHIVVDPGKVLNRISPSLYGSCIEDVNHEIYGGLYGQRIFGESFEEPDDKHGVSRMWDPVGDATFSLGGDAYNGDQCQKIVHARETGEVGVANRGLNRWGISVREGQAMEGRIYLRGDISDATVALQSADGAKTYAAQLISVTEPWTKRTFHFRPNTTDPNARFAVLFNEKGTLWVDQAVLIDSDRFHGLPIRGDIARAMVAEHLTFLRYGGSMVNAPGYRWKQMIGDPDKRPPYHGTWYPFSTNGFGIFDFLNFCEAAKIEAAFAINVEEKPEDAADLADYLTAPTTTYWGARRAADGHPKPYHPAYIEIGNEEAIGNPNHDNLVHYAERFRQLANAIHSRNPNLKLVCAAWWVPNSPEMKTVFDAVDGKAAAWDFHYWCDDANAGNAIDRDLTRAEQLFKSWNPKSNLKVVIFEENGNRHDLQRALGHATTVNAVRRHGDFVLADCAANCLQPWKQNDNGWDQGQIFFSPDRVWEMPPYFAQQMLSEDHLPLRVAASADGGLDVLATRSEDGKTVVLTVVNIAEQPIEASVALNDFRIRSVRARAFTSEPSKTDRAAVLNSVKGVANIDFAAHSITSVRFSQ